MPLRLSALTGQAATAFLCPHISSPHDGSFPCPVRVRLKHRHPCLSCVENKFSKNIDFFTLFDKNVLPGNWGIIMNKSIVTLLVIFSLFAGIAAPDFSFAGVSFFDDKGMDISVQTNTSPLFAVVNENFTRQARMLAGLVNFATKLAGNTLPKQDTKAKNGNRKDCVIMPSLLAKAVRTEMQPLLTLRTIPVNESGSSLQFLSLCVWLLATSFLHIRRFRFRKCIYALPRGSIDDMARTVYRKFAINPHIPQRNEGFLFGEYYD
jgi:hypothetical protein